MKYKVYKVKLDEKRSLVYQFDVGEVRPGTSPVDAAVDYILVNVPHQISLAGTSPLMDSNGVHLTKWLVLDDTDIYWFIPVNRFLKSPEPIKVEYQERCRLGYCATKNSHYDGGDDSVRAKIRSGICPTCGGPLENG